MTFYNFFPEATQNEHHEACEIPLTSLSSFQVQPLMELDLNSTPLDLELNTSSLELGSCSSPFQHHLEHGVPELQQGVPRQQQRVPRHHQGAPLQLLGLQPLQQQQQTPQQQQQTTSQRQQQTTSQQTEHPNKTRRLTNEERRHVAHLLTLAYHDGKLKRGTINKLGQQFSVTRQTIGAIWKKTKKAIRRGQTPAVDRMYKGGKRRIFIDLEKVRRIPLHLRTNIRTLTHALKAKKSSVHMLIRRGKIRSHSNSIKPLLTQENMKNRMMYVLSKIKPETLRSNPTFDDMAAYVMIDEKWFFMTRTSSKYYLHPCESEPHRTCKSKRFITKIMFMGAVAQPSYSSDGTLLWDGKFGIFPFTYTTPAKRASKNRPKGEMETKPIESITKEVIKECLLTKVIPAIKANWPEGRTKRIIIQQDNAKPHLSPNDPDFLRVAKSVGFDISIECQPANNPDLNVLDLRFFRSIPTLQHEKCPKTVCQLVNAVLMAFEESKPETLAYVWLSFKYCMSEVLKSKGSNSYKIPHHGKRHLARIGQLTLHEYNIYPDKTAVEEAMALLNMPNQIMPTRL